LSRFVQYHTCDVDLNNLGALSISPALNVTVQDNTATASATASYDPTKAFCSPPKVTYDLKLTRGPSTGNPPFSNTLDTGTITETDLTKSLSGIATGLAYDTTYKVAVEIVKKGFNPASATPANLDGLVHESSCSQSAAFTTPPSSCAVDLLDPESGGNGALSVTNFNINPSTNGATAGATVAYDPTKTPNPSGTTYELKLTRGPATGNPPFSNLFTGKKSTGTITGTDLTKSLSGATTGLASGTTYQAALEVTKKVPGASDDLCYRVRPFTTSPSADIDASS